MKAILGFGLVLGVLGGCGDDETGGGTTTGTTASSTGGAGTGGVGTGATGGSGDGGGGAGQGGNGTGGAPTGGAGPGGAGQGGAGGAGSAADAFCAEYETKCGFGGNNKFNSLSDCVDDYTNKFDAAQIDCVETHLDYINGSDPGSIHCQHAAGNDACG